MQRNRCNRSAAHQKSVAGYFRDDRNDMLQSFALLHDLLPAQNLLALKSGHRLGGKAVVVILYCRHPPRRFKIDMRNLTGRLHGQKYRQPLYQCGYENKHDNA